MATNVAETSLIIDGVVYVVDPGFVRQNIYNPRIKVEVLIETPISKASALQRAGRAGRTRPGKCFRLYTEKSFVKELEDETQPDILRCNMANTILKLVKFGIEDLIRFDYLDSPSPEALMRALELLNQLEAIDDEGNLTLLGRTMADFPVDPQSAKMMIVSPEFQCSEEVTTIVAMLSVPNVWLRPQNERREADQAKALLSLPEGDHLTLLNVYNQYVQNPHDNNWSQNNNLSSSALMQASNIRTQLQRAMENSGLNVKGPGLWILLGGRLLVRRERGDMLPSKITKLLFYTRHSYIRTVTEINPEWIFECAPAYYDLVNFPRSNAKKALQKVYIRYSGKVKAQPETKKCNKKGR